MKTDLKIMVSMTVLLLNACVHTESFQKAVNKADKRGPDQSAYFQSEDADETRTMEEKSSGSLWADTYGSHLYDNMYRAHRLGDTVVITVSEVSQGKNTGDTKSDKKVEHSASIDNLGGVLQKIAGMATKVLPGFDPSNLIGAKTDSKFQGKASTERTNSLDAKISATVVRILRNGNMVLRGEKHVKVNKEDQILIVEGIIRPYDILPDNSVLSSSLADARITYSGFGIVAERQSPGWMVRALDYIWPF